jgi:hypothetical protein
LLLQQPNLLVDVVNLMRQVPILSKHLRDYLGKVFELSILGGAFCASRIFGKRVVYYCVKDKLRPPPRKKALEVHSLRSSISSTYR